MARREPTERQRAQIRRELRGEAGEAGESQRPVPDGWITLKQAAPIVGSKSITSIGIAALRGLPCRTFRTGGVGRRPLIFRRCDIERVAMIRRATRLPLLAAVRVVVAENEGRIDPALGKSAGQTERSRTQAGGRCDENCE